MSNEIARFEKIIQGFDENLQLRALKTEFSELMISLRAYTKEKTFKSTVKSISASFDAVNANLQNFEENLEQQAAATKEVLR